MTVNRLIVVFLLALAFAGAGTPMTRRLALRLGLLDRPGTRKLQKVPIPLLGGLAIIVAVFGGLAAAGVERFGMPGFGDPDVLRQVAGTLAGATLVAAIGLWDDHRPLPAWVKLAGQLVAGGVLVASGISVQLTHLAWLDTLISLVWIVGITNAINLLDNMDGLSSGVVAVAASFFALLAVLQLPVQFLVGGLAAAVAGGSLGFWYHNFYRSPATIFMGDVGALFLGFVLAMLGIKLRFPSNTPVVTWMVPVLVLGLPIFDTTLVTFSRLRRGRNPLTTPGLDHLSHRLVERGLTRREAVLTLHLVAGALGMTALFVTRANAYEAYAVAGALALFALYALWQLEWRRPAPQPAPG
jgi:UDP-GlcNAc:undecaprenyl-phosphate GlcNAc-1-phosphate transferase